MLDIGKYITDDYYGQDGNSYDQLAGDWALYYKIARYFIHKVKREDKYDFLRDLMLEMAKVKAKYEAAKKIPNLPQYMEHCFLRLIDQLDRMEYIKGAIKAVRNDIPDGAIEAEREGLRHGSTQPLM